MSGTCSLTDPDSRPGRRRSAVLGRFAQCIGHEQQLAGGSSWPVLRVRNLPAHSQRRSRHVARLGCLGQCVGRQQQPAGGSRSAVRRAERYPAATPTSAMPRCYTGGTHMTRKQCLIIGVALFALAAVATPVVPSLAEPWGCPGPATQARARSRPSAGRAGLSRAGARFGRGSAHTPVRKGHLGR